MELRLRRHLERVDERLARVGCERATAIVWIAFAVLALALHAARGITGWPVTVTAGVLLALGVVCVLGLRRFVARRRRAPMTVARLVEQRFPDLDTSLLAAAELEPDLPGGQYGFLARRLVDDVMRKARHQHWAEEVGSARLPAVRGLHVAGVLAFAASLALLFCAERIVPGASPAERAGTTPGAAVVVLPGDVEIEAGRSVLVTAEFDPSRVPGAAELVYRPDGGEPERAPMSRSLDDPVFGARLATIREHLTYHVEWRGGATRTYRLTVFERPELVRADVVLRYPEYTGRAERRIEDTRRITAPEGTWATVVCRLNKAVVEATFTDEATGAATPLVVDPANALERSATFQLTRSMRIVLTLVDDAGRTSAKTVVIVFHVTENDRPALRLTSAGDLRVSPIEELALRARLSDDYGLERFGVSYRVGGEASVEVVLGAAVGRGAQVEAEHTIALEELGAEPAQLVSYHFWAEDRDQEGELRRTSSDLFFAAVRPFEEVFRQAEPPPGGGEGGGGGGGAGGAEGAAEVAELQRDVVLATWNLIRRGVDDAGTFEADVAVIQEAQQLARDRLDELGGDDAMNPLRAVDDADATLLEIGRQMDRALRELARARAEVAIEPLYDALAAEQAADQALLELSEEELQVARANSQGQGSGSGRGGPSQAQLGELELDAEQNRYETQSAARPERALDDDVARETRQALSRLKELARRQADLNERVRELAAELQAAETEAEHEELRRRLKRLQEAQEEILRDTDELAQRMEEAASRQGLPEQRERLTEQSQQLAETRENERRASEALEEGRLSQALTEGSRASRGLSELEGELRDAAGGQLEDRMRAMQREARRIEAEEQRLAEALEETAAAARRSLREDTARAELQDALEQQAADLDELLTDAEQTVRDAETTEPLLAEELFEAVGEARNRRVAEALEMTREMLARGFPAQARAAERQASEGVRELREGIEAAAASVLGTGAEALERAQAELERLTRELESEIAEARGAGALEPGEPGEPGEAGEPGEPGEASRAGGEPTQGGDEPGAGGEEPGRGSGEAAGEPGQGRGGGGERVAEGEPAPGAPGGRRGAPRSLTGPGPDQPETGGGGGLGGGRFAGSPLTGEDFLDWSDRLRDVEEMLDDPELSAEAARVRSRARTVREEFKRHSKEPDWELVDEKIAVPLAELARRIADEVRRRRADDRLVPIDRDPVPPEFEEAVRRYYERLGRTR